MDSSFDSARCSTALIRGFFVRVGEYLGGPRLRHISPLRDPSQPSTAGAGEPLSESLGSVQITTELAPPVT